MITTVVAYSMMFTALQSQPRIAGMMPYLQEGSEAIDQASERKAAITELIKALNENYVMPEIAKKIEGELTKWMKSDEFKKLSDPKAFTARVNEILKANVRDAHLGFRYSPNVLPERKVATEPSEAELKQYEVWVRRENSNFRAVERLEGNIGYIALDGFQGQAEVKRPMAAAMNFLADTDAMIIDLRQNGGGDPAGVQLVCSYFFDETPVHLNSIYMRSSDAAEQFWTLKELDAPRFLNKPVYVLVGKRTASGGEECAYDLQQLKRATIIGEPTWGGANPGDMVRLGDHYSCFIPVGRAENPYTKTNWEGTGVIPDVKADPAKSKEIAQLMLVKELLAKETDDEYKESLGKLVKRLEPKNK